MQTCGFRIENFCILKMEVRYKNDKRKTQCCYFKPIISIQDENKEEEGLSPDKLIQYHTFHKNKLYSSLGALSLVFSVTAN